MISDVVITGYLKERKAEDNNFRYIETSNKRGFGEGEITYSIPLLYWTRDKDNVLNRMKEKTLVIIKGRIESNEDMGLYVLVEAIQLTGVTIN